MRPSLEGSAPEIRSLMIEWGPPMDRPPLVSFCGALSA